MMSSILFLNQVCVYLWICLLSLAVINDLSSFRIPNWISLAGIVLFIVFVITAKEKPDVLHSVLIMLGVLVVGMALFAFGITGGGDVKLLTVTSLWAGLMYLADTLLVVAVVGGLMSVVVIAYSLYRTYFFGLPLDIRRTKLPYGLAIAGGGYYTAFQYLVPVQYWLPEGGVL